MTNIDYENTKKTKNITISSSLHKKLKIMASSNGSLLKDYIEHVINVGLSKLEK